ATVLLATHNFDEAVSVGHRVAVLCQGRLVELRALHAGTSVADLRELYFQQVDVEHGPVTATRGAS
ncbi:MAG: hypothetical protein ACRD2Q_08770, partial [Terriglobales bacterium]